MGGCIHETTGKGRCQEVSERVSLLEDATHQASSCFWKIFKGSGGCISVQATHSNTEQSATCQKLSVGLRETRTLERSMLV